MTTATLPGAADEVIATMTGLGGESLLLHVDLTKQEEVEALVALLRWEPEHHR